MICRQSRNAVMSGEFAPCERRAITQYPPSLAPCIHSSMRIALQKVFSKEDKEQGIPQPCQHWKGLLADQQARQSGGSMYEDCMDQALVPEHMPATRRACSQSCTSECSYAAVEGSWLPGVCPVTLSDPSHLREEKQKYSELLSCGLSPGLLDV